MGRGAWWAAVDEVVRVGHDLVTKTPPPLEEVTLKLRSGGGIEVSQLNVGKKLIYCGGEWCYRQRERSCHFQGAAAQVGQVSKPDRNFGPYFKDSKKWAFPGGSDGKESACNVETQVQSLGQKDPLKKDMATHPGNFAWRIPWTEEPSGLQSMGSQKSQSRLSN